MISANGQGSRNLFATLSGDPAGYDLAGEVARHLGWLLNSWRGGCLQDGEFGIPHFAEFGSFPHAENHFGRELQATVDRYEPRLQGVRVRVEPRVQSGAMSPFFARYALTATLIDRRDGATYAAEFVVNLNGGVAEA